MLDALREGCFVVGRDLTYLYLNDAAARQSHRPRTELLGRKMPEEFPGIEKTPFWSVLLRAMEGTAHERLESFFKYPDGTSAWFELRFVPVPEGVFILSLDITARVRAEQSRSLLATAIDQAVEAGADWVLLDNMNPVQLRLAVQKCKGRAQTEASGGVNLANVRAIADTGVDFISIGALTHSTRAVDMGLDFEG